MAQERPATPEKQLLKLIEETNTKDVRVQSRALKRRGLSLLSPGAWLGRFSFLKDRVSALGKGGRGLSLDILDIKVVNNFLMVGVFLLAVSLASTVTMSAVNAKNVRAVHLKLKEGAKVSVTPVASRLQELSYYIDRMRERDIFKMGKKKEEAPAPSGAPSSAFVSATEHLKLVGIAWSSDPDAMIEDTKFSKTYFVKRGQMIGEFKVEAIYRDKVVLSYEKEEVELR